jgi:hypothetical protein
MFWKNMAMRNTSELKAISAKFGIVIPTVLESLIDSGAASYPADFNKNSSQILTTNPPALWATYDLEWLDDNAPSGVLSEWLAPEYQHGNFFVPFAQSGGGDIYALIKLASGEQGGALLWHDNPESEINYLSFEDFICGRFLDAMTDLSHLEDNLSPEEAVDRGQKTERPLTRPLSSVFCPPLWIVPLCIQSTISLPFQGFAGYHAKFLFRIQASCRILI